MQIQVKLFAVVREQAGVAELTLDLPPGATVADAVEALSGRLSTIRQHLNRVAYAVNRAYATTTTKMHDGDELAVIPPVSGG